MAGKKFKIESVVVCEDVRQERTGKFILIGVFNNIVALRFPVEQRLAFWVQYTPDALGEHPIEFRLVGGQGEEFFVGKMPQTVRIQTLSAFVIGPAILNFQVPTKLKLQLKAPEDTSWQTVKIVELERASDAPTSNKK